MEFDYERHYKTCRFVKPGRFKRKGDWDVKNRTTLVKVDLTLHLFATIEAAERSQRLLFGMPRFVWGHGLWEGLYVTFGDLIPVISLRLGRDEEAYKFIYRHKNCICFYLANSAGRRSGFNSLNQLSKGRRALGAKAITIEGPRRSFEEVQERAGLGHQVALTFLGIKALRHLQYIRRLNRVLRVDRVNGNVIPQEVINNICAHLGSESGFLENLFGFDLIEATRDEIWMDSMMSKMQALVTRCVYETGRTNRHIWRWMLDTGRLAARDEFGQFDPMEEDAWDSQGAAEAVAVRQYQLWMEAPGSFDVLSKAVAAAARWASKRGFCWPIERQPYHVLGMPVPYPHYFIPGPDDE